MSALATTLPNDLVFEGGHASDVALSALADGQLEILGADVQAHVDGCAACTARLGRTALLSAHVSDALVAWDRERPETRTADLAFASRTGAGDDFALPRAIPPAPVRRPLPFLAIAAALVVAILAAGPSFADPTGEPRWHAWVRAPLGLAGHILWTAVRQALRPSHVATALQWGASILFTLLAVVVAVVLGKNRSSQGEA